jgi:hypothetical protein
MQIPGLSGEETLFTGFTDAGGDTFFVYVAKAFCRNLEGDVTVFVGQEKGTGLEVGKENPFGFLVRMRHLIPFHIGFAGNFTHP